MVGPDGEEQDPWTYEVARSPEDLARWRASGVDRLTGMEEIPAMNAMLLVLKRSGRPVDEPIVFTCDSCERAPVCKLAFDPYNTDGDCLWDK